MNMTNRAISPRIQTAITGALLAGALLVCVPAGTALADDAGSAIQDMKRDIKADKANIETDKAKHEDKRLEKDKGRLKRDEKALDDLLSAR
jgi:hypothetical protein